jgi:hypothetical protein
MERDITKTIRIFLVQMCNRGTWMAQAENLFLGWQWQCPHEIESQAEGQD